MDLEVAFTQDAIDEAGTSLEGEEEAEVRRIIRLIYESNQWDVPGEHELNIGVLCFIAGRTHQEDRQLLAIEMRPELAARFMQFLHEEAER